MESANLIKELISAFKAGGFHAEAKELETLLSALLEGSEEEKRRAAQEISNRCHVKWYGDVNVEMPGGGYALWNHLSKIQKSLGLLSNHSLQARRP